MPKNNFYKKIDILIAFIVLIIVFTRKHESSKQIAKTTNFLIKVCIVVMTICTVYYTFFK